MSLIESAIALIIVSVDARLLGLGKFHSWNQILLFPAIWVSVWCVITHLSPIGRLIMWSPTEGIGRLSWLIPITGPPIVDWTVAACAVLVTGEITNMQITYTYTVH